MNIVSQNHQDWDIASLFIADFTQPCSESVISASFGKYQPLIARVDMQIDGFLSFARIYVKGIEISFEIIDELQYVTINGKMLK
jgi:hypothetical protein